MLIHIPNLLTLFRVALIPVLVVMYFWPSAYREAIVAGIFLLAACTDWLDGFLARQMDAASQLGAFLDPVADKLIVSTALVLLVADADILGMVLHPMPFAIAVAIIIGREIVVSALREWMAELGDRGAVAVGSIGKFKTASQMVSIIALLYAKPLLGLPVFRLGEILFYIAAILTLWSMFEYLRAAHPRIRENGVVR
ncbi:MAG: CDP-diacylglycerol--glycerol-3-phosphate 3-phosphatidyltransferase [Gammaproteobacteria bacterium]|nr:CDP-diacylglycerol--glycerol-3-phosphate 3-phosphatidyltransferase [Gammaproteobacteria bacterium]CAJ2376602.1 MAG: CDP-diacylglycerol--glycerol-3-phosphate 3-phosphatidyltransferase [Arenicellales bacterium IbO2]MDA7961467.1 CDP-diacylglycerol--glycerol-3-phosphate 3-phosphatidyltransferase [Gammaproteobacteria bacterium]MDA7969896.1 CDP-diacylglycerol--glycerol-3-phosphate 3-phosphatidyltransferase [Gammaproteobacteria bacterium]MDA7971243.1 CDP-diacylglycerol--glycerol-3-phosphate 3-phosp